MRLICDDRLGVIRKVWQIGAESVPYLHYRTAPPFINLMYSTLLQFLNFQVSLNK